MLRNYSIENIKNASSISMNKHAVASIDCGLYNKDVQDRTYTFAGEPKS